MTSPQYESVKQNKSKGWRNGNWWESVFQQVYTTQSSIHLAIIKCKQPQQHFPTVLPINLYICDNNNKLPQ